MGEVSLNFADTLRSAPLASQSGYQTDVAQQTKLITPQTSQRQLYRVNYAGPSLAQTYAKTGYMATTMPKSITSMALNSMIQP